MNLSLRTRLVVGIVVLMGCGLLIADIAGVVLLRSYLLQRIDQQLSPPISGNPTGTRAAPQLCATAATNNDQQLPTNFTITVLRADGTLHCRLPPETAASDSPDVQQLSPDELATAAADARVVEVPGTLSDTNRRRRVTSTQGEFVILAVSLAEVDATVRRLQLVAAGSGAAILLLAGLGGFALVRVGLRPLTAIEATAEAIARGDLTRRIRAAPVKTEVGRLAAALNAMLTQIEHAFTARTASEERLRRFVADASHELRTPLSTIRGHAELYRHGVATEPHDVAQLLSRIESESMRMGALVDDLLLLARLDASPELARRPVDLLSLVADAVVDARAQDPGRSIVLRRRSTSPWTDAPPVVLGDDARLRQVLANLLSNALRHTPQSAPVEVEVGVLGDNVQLFVIDHGPGIAPDLVERVFERFFRGDSGRTRAQGGTGLGLSIVASLIAAHQGSVRCQPTYGHGSTFMVTLPAATGHAAQADRPTAPT